MTYQASQTVMLDCQNPTGYWIQGDLLLEFERGLDSLHPERSAVPCRILGYGEISTVFEIDVEGLCDLAFKCMCIFETIPATLGIAVPPEDFFAGVRQLCDRWGALMIMDEVQTGLGRCGKVWGIDTYGVTPDIIVTGKGLSGGIYPVSATLYSDRLDSFFHENPFIHISTFGGAEVGCFVALEVLDILQEPGFLEHVVDMAALFEAGFADLVERHPRALVAARQRGLMMGLKLAGPRMGPWMTAAGFQAGLLAIYANNDSSVVQVLPPLIIQEADVNRVLAILDSMLSELERAFHV